MTAVTRRLGLATLLTMAVAAPAARGQEDTPVFGRRQARNWITLDSYGGAVELFGHYQADATNSGGSKARSTDAFLAESINLYARTHLLSPNLLDLYASGTFGLTQDWFSGTGQAMQNTTGFLQEYDFQASLIRQSFTPIELTASRQQTYISRPFAVSEENDLTQFGANVQFNSSIIPSYLQATHIDSQQTDVGSSEPNLDLTQNNIVWHSEAAPTDRQHVTLDYRYTDSNQTGQSTEQLASNEVSATHAWQLDPNGFYNLTTNLNLISQTGDTPYDRYHLDTTLRLQHSDWFETNYNYTIEQQEYPTNSQLTNRVHAGFIHRLYDSLMTSGNSSYSQINRTNGGDTRDLAASLSFDYTKKVPYGRFLANLAIGFDQQNSDASTSATDIVNQPYTFTDPVPIVINGNSIDPTSLVLTDVTGTRRYTEGIDYTVTGYPTRVEIRRIVSGNIADHQTILTDYTILPLPGSATTTTTFGLGGRYDITEGWLQGLSPYVRYFQQDQSITADPSATFLPDNIREYTLGADYRIWKLLFNVEAEDHQSTLYPFQAFRASVQHTDRVLRNAVWNNSLNYSYLTYPADDNHNQFISLVSHLDYRLTRELHLIATGTFRDQQDLIYGNNQGFDVLAELRWKHRQTQIYATLHTYYLLNSAGSGSGGSDGDSLSVFFRVGIRREF